jgi:hypothetical protein
MSVDEHGPLPVRRPVPERPRIPDAYGRGRPDEPPGTRLLWATVEDRLVKARAYWLTTTRPDGRPHAVPVWGLWHGGYLYFSTGAETVTARNLAANPAALAHLGNGDQVTIIEGAVEGFTDRPGVVEFAARYERKYDWPIDPDAPPGPIQRLVAAQVLSWDADDNLVETMTRWRYR